MTKSDLYLGPPRDLTPNELDALMHVREGVRISEGLYYKLELRDLIEKGLDGWQLTEAGEFRLASKR
jgi:hypothetical protein